MSKGYVYILSNPSMPDLVKIGRTMRDPKGRANELYVTGVPTPFVVEHEFLTLDCVQLEEWAHAVFSDERVSESREFFKVPVRDAYYQIMNLLISQLETTVQDVLPNACLIAKSYYVCEKAIDKFCDDLSATPKEVSAALAEISTDELRGALERVKDKPTDDPQPNVVSING